MTSPSAAAETAQSIRDFLEPFVRPREEATHIRRVLAAHLAACLKSDDALEQHPALVDVSWDVTPSPETRGLQRAYLQSLQANLQARRAFEKAREAAAAAAAAASTAAPTASDRLAGQTASSSSSSVLEDHLTAVRLARKKERLQVVHRYLDTLGAKPAAVVEDFLRPEAVYGAATRTLPPVPQAVVDGLAEDETEAAVASAAAAAATAGTADPSSGPQTAVAADLARLAAQLEKALLRAQLLLRQEEKRLSAAKTQQAASQASPTTTAAAKLQALGTARDALIAWMETELSNAGEEDGGGGGGEDDYEDEDDKESSRQLRQSLLGATDHDSSSLGGNTARIDERLAAIRDKYARYVEARQALVQMTGGKTGRPLSVFANMPQLVPAEKAAAAEAQASPQPHPPSQAASRAADDRAAAALGQLLLTPYLERLLAVAHDQKANIAHKAHYHVLLAKRLKDTCQALDHLADESHLLPQHAQEDDDRGGGGGSSRDGHRRRRSSTDILGGPGGPRDRPEGAAQRAAAWTYAADSAKITTFEAVAEQVETGQVALERASEALDEADELLGRRPEGEQAEAEAEAEAQAEAETAGSHKGRRPTRHQTRHKASSGDIWATLHGDLGVINQRTA